VHSYDHHSRLPAHIARQHRREHLRMLTHTQCVCGPQRAKQNPPRTVGFARTEYCMSNPLLCPPDSTTFRHHVCDMHRSTTAGWRVPEPAAVSSEPAREDGAARKRDMGNTHRNARNELRALGAAPASIGQARSVAGKNLFIIVPRVLPYAARALVSLHDRLLRPLPRNTHLQKAKRFA
jgi:hypothetical protein